MTDEQWIDWNAQNDEDWFKAVERDFGLYCHRINLSIELDGGYHLTSEQTKKDKERTKYLNSVGITEIRFNNEEVLNKSSVVIQKIENKLRAGSPLGAGGKRGHKT